MNTKHLKAKILDLAIRGKLVPQDSFEGNAAELLQKIREEKSELVKQKKIKEDKNASFIIKADDGKHYEQFPDGSLKDIEDEIPFEIPENWCWCRISNISKLVTKGTTPRGGNVAYSKQGIGFLRAENIIDGAINKLNLKYIDRQTHNNFLKRSILEENDLLITIAGSLGRSAIVKKSDLPLNTNQAIAIVRLVNNENVSLRYIMYAINSPTIKDNLIMQTKVTAIPNLTLEIISNCILPLPPLSEQQRIVSAIEKAFEQIDIIEKNKLNLKTYIKQTKSKILDLAIHGKLVEQNLQEGNAFELLEKIRHEKAELVKQKKLKEDKNASFIIKADNGKHYEQFTDGSLKDVEDEIPFEIPENWCWCRLGDISKLVTKGTTPRGGNVAYSKQGIGFLRAENINNGEINKLNLKYIDEQTHNNFLKRSILEENDLLITIAGSLGRSAIVKKSDLPLNTNQAIAIVRLVNNENLSLRFLMYAINSQIIKDTLILQTKVTAIPNLTLEIISNCILPLPPLSEQKRIVAKIEQVLEQLDVLEKSLEE